ncbi:MAG: cell division protein SepF [Nitriliruptoraceae bacterium]
MSGIWDRTLVYLGLREEPDTFDNAHPIDSEGVFVPEHDPHAAHAPARPNIAASAPVTSNVRALRPDELPHGGFGMATDRVAIVEVNLFDDVEGIASRYRSGQVVLFEMPDVDVATGRRVLDFVAGLTYGLRGKLTKLRPRVFLLVPEGRRVPVDEIQRLEGLGYTMMERN